MGELLTKGSEDIPWEHHQARGPDLQRTQRTVPWIHPTSSFVVETPRWHTSPAPQSWISAPWPAWWEGNRERGQPSKLWINSNVQDGYIKLNKQFLAQLTHFLHRTEHLVCPMEIKATQSKRNASWPSNWWNRNGFHPEKWALVFIRGGSRGPTASFHNESSLPMTYQHPDEEFRWSHPKDEYDREQIRNELFREIYNSMRDEYRARIEACYWYDWEDDIIETIAHIEEHNRPRWWRAWFRVKNKRIDYRNLVAVLHSWCSHKNGSPSLRTHLNYRYDYLTST